MPPARTVVMDAGAAMRLQRLERVATSATSTNGVLNEIQRAHQRQHLQTLPFPVKPDEPELEDVRRVEQFAKLTGDYGFLSANDTRLIALAVKLCRQRGIALRERPEALEVSENQISQQVWRPEDDPAELRYKFWQSWRRETALDIENLAEKDGVTAPVHLAPAAQSTERVDFWDLWREETAEAMATLRAKDDGKEAEPVPKFAPASRVQGFSQEETVDASDDDSDSDGGWVTKETIKKMGRTAATGAAAVDDADAPIAMLSSDYSVQNVCMQMGIECLTMEGLKVRSLKLWALLCRACYETTRDTSKIFCPKCGHATVERVPCTVDSTTGVYTVHDGKAGRPRNLKGTIYSIPKYKGGRNWGPVFSQDELMMGGRDREMRRLQKQAERAAALADPFNDDGEGWFYRHATSTGKVISQRGGPRMVAGYGRRNPNANNFKHKKK